MGEAWKMFVMARSVPLIILWIVLACLCSADVNDRQWHPFSLLEEGSGSGSGETTESPETSPVPVTTANILNCQNGGTFDGTMCICPSGYNGTLCEFLQTVKPENIIGVVGVSAKIIHTYDEDYADKNSEAFKGFASNFQTTMFVYYQKSIPNVKEVIVLSVRSGTFFFKFQTIQEISPFEVTTAPASSVIVDHEVNLIIPNDGKVEETFQKDIQKLQGAGKELVNCRDCPYTAVDDPTVTPEDLDFHFVCKKLGVFYQVSNESGLIECVTPCDKRHSDKKTCLNGGECQMMSIGPICKCLNTESTWYLDDSCSHPIQRLPFYIGLSVTLAGLLLIVGGMAVYVILHRGSGNQKKDAKEKLVKDWLKEDFEWSRSNNAMKSHDAGDNRYQLPPAFYRESATNVRPAPIQMRIPSMPRAELSFDSAYSARPYTNMPSNQQMRVSRPPNRQSWDI